MTKSLFSSPSRKLDTPRYDKIELLAEQIAGVHERIGRETAEIRRELRGEFATTHAAIESLFAAKH